MQQDRTSSRTKVLALLGVVAAVAAVVAIVTSLTGNDSKQSSGASSTSVGVTTESGAIPTVYVDAASVNRFLDTPGSFTCAAPGVWHPFADNAAAVLVGEPSAAASCSLEVAAVPPGYCTTQPCAQVPADWQVRSRVGVSTQNLFLVVVPTTQQNALFYCVVEGVVGSAQALDQTVQIEQACPFAAPAPPVLATDDTTDIPYVPPVTSDIPAAPPPQSPVSADIPSP